MKIHVIDVVDQEDGGAIINLDLDQEAVEFLVQYAVKDILMNAVTRDMTNVELLGIEPNDGITCSCGCCKNISEI